MAKGHGIIGIVNWRFASSMSHECESLMHKQTIACFDANFIFYTSFICPPPFSSTESGTSARVRKRCCASLRVLHWIWAATFSYCLQGHALQQPRLLVSWQPNVMGILEPQAHSHSGGRHFPLLCTWHSDHFVEETLRIVKNCIGEYFDEEECYMCAICQSRKMWL